MAWQSAGTTWQETQFHTDSQAHSFGCVFFIPIDEAERGLSDGSRGSKSAGRDW